MKLSVLLLVILTLCRLFAPLQACNSKTLRGDSRDDGMDERELVSPPLIWCRMQHLDIQYIDDSEEEGEEDNWIEGHVEPRLSDPFSPEDEAEQNLMCVVQHQEAALATEKDAVPAGIYQLRLPETVVAQLDLRDSYGSRLAVVNMQGVNLAQALIETNEQTLFYVVPSTLRRNAQEKEQPQRKTILVLRVTHQGVEPTATREDLERAILNGPVNLVSQLAGCSFGKLQLQAMQPGVLNVVVEGDTNDGEGTPSSVRGVENAAVQAASNLLGAPVEQLVDHLLLVMPPGLRLNGRNYLAYAYLGGTRSVYNDKWGKRLSALSHEFAHNLGLAHAGRGTEPYGDRTGYLGYGSNQLGGPVSCFNAQKHWELGWFQERTLSLALGDLPWTGTLATFVDYDRIGKASEAPVVLQVGEANPRFFVQYNRAKGINRETRDLADQVVIVMDRGSGDDRGEQSWLQGGLSLERPRFLYVYEDGSTLIIELCNLFLSDEVDSVRMSIRREEDGSQQTADTKCAQIDETSAPAPKLSNEPTPRPTSVEDEKEDATQAECTNNYEAKFFVDAKRGMRDCSWLERKLGKWEARLCVPDHAAFKACPETCQSCSETCEDDPTATFYVSKKRGWKDCEWLSTQTKWQRKLCKPNQAATSFCRETCDSCAASS